MPWNDWQFWIVSALAIGGLWIVMRTIVPARRRRAVEDPACPNCASGGASSRPPRRRVQLTIDRRKT
jgi:hypothetical protein